MPALGEEGLRDYIKSIGLYRAKAKNVIALSKFLLRNMGAKFPVIVKLWRPFPAWGAKPPMWF